MITDAYAFLGPLQDEVTLWVARNFGTGHPVPTICGLGEEAGEVMRALTKRAQHVRGTHAEWTAELRKELGDVIIKLCDCATEWGVDLTDAMANHWVGLVGGVRYRSDDEATLGARLMVAVAQAMQAATHEGLAVDAAPVSLVQRCGDVVVAVADLVDYSAWDLERLVRERWAVVGARDFTTNPIGHGMPA